MWLMLGKCETGLLQVYEDEGWKYLSCPKCRSKVTLNGTNYWYFNCEAWEKNPDGRSRLQNQISDKHGVVDATAFSEAACDLLDISLEAMNFLEQKTDTGEEEIHDQLIKIIGKEYLFRIKIGDYNLQNSQKALTI